MSGRRTSCIALLCWVVAACEPSRIHVEFYTVDSHAFSTWERAFVTLIAEAAEREVRARLPQLPDTLMLRVQAGQAFEVDEHTGDTTAVLGPNAVMWTVDPRHMGSVIGVALRELRVSLFH